jgi:hypothetical protein
MLVFATEVKRIQNEGIYPLKSSETTKKNEAFRGLAKTLHFYDQ